LNQIEKNETWELVPRPTNKNVIGTKWVFRNKLNEDWEGNVDDRKSISGGSFFLGKNLVSWSIKKQSSISLSTTKDKYIAVATCCTQVLWMKSKL
jgi:hypothetical protein